MTTKHMIDPNMSNFCMKERMSAKPRVSKSKIHADEAFGRTFSFHIFTKGLFYVSNGLFLVLVSTPLGILILLDIQ